MPHADPPAPDVWARLRDATRARIGLGRVGNALPLGALLDFQLAHARARDAVHSPLDVEAVRAGLHPVESVVVRSAAPDRAAYLRRPDLGRTLDPACLGVLEACRPPADGWDAVFVIADGLSPAAVQEHAAPLVHACLQRLPGWSVAPVVVATQARVALGDEVSEVLGAQLCVVLIGERPGLSVANSMGVYLTYGPRVGRRDSERNCVSNIHGDGLLSEAAAELVAWLMTEAARRKLSGVDLKDDRAVLAEVAASRLTSSPSPSGRGLG